ncbi:olfactory receptor 2D3-like [Rana temporaria]|uniref:olfactory receptor 2D3-like n=1 Tax=Rana temporaria TaxID=8407 RepID=UPI001AAD7DD3|nr:olfactory receptor 2D3-like [Rana temporaria]
MDNHTINNVFYLNAFAFDIRLKSFFFVFFLILFLITVIGNLFIIILTHIDSHLQTPMYFFLKNLSFLDICYTSTTVPQMLVNLLINHVAISFPACIIQLYTFLSLAASESSLLATMAYDRYVAICNPLRYSVIMSRDVCIHMVVGAWVIGSIYGIIHTVNTFRLPFCGPKVLNHYFCDILPLFKISCINTYVNEVTVFAVGGFLMIGCFVLICGSYIHILFLVLSIPKGGGRMKAFSTCVSHLVVVLLFYGSGSFMYMRPKSNLLADKEWLLSIFYTSITPLLNPIIYSLRNKDIRKALRIILNSH